MTSTVFEHFSPSYPQRAAWGTAAKLRAWQAEALQQYLENPQQDFLAVATPGAGKTTFALRVANELKAQKRIRRIVVITPTEQLKAQAVAHICLRIDPNVGAVRQDQARQNGRSVSNVRGQHH